MSYIGRLTKGALVSSDGTNNSELPVGADTFVLTADSAMPLGVKWAAGGGGGGGTSLTGNTGGAINPVGGNIDILTANATPLFAGTAGTQTLDFGLSNLSLGTSLPALNVGTQNCTFGLRSGAAIDNGIGNSIFGYETARNLTTGSNNCAFGKQSLFGITTSVQNCAFGNSALQNLLLSIGSNTAIGYGSLIALVTGTANAALGEASGSAYTGAESSNICLGSNGVIGDNNTIRIGNPGPGVSQQNRVFCAGITGVTVAASAPAAVDANGQISSLGFGTATQVLTSNGAAASPTWESTGFGPSSWTDVTATSITMAINNNYMANNAGLVTLTLPATATQFSKIMVKGYGAGGFRISQNANQVIRFGNISTTVGVTGCLLSSDANDGVELLCVVGGASTVWSVLSSFATIIVI